jgi:hypothetical protein
MQKMKKEMEGLNQKFVPVKYLQDDWIGILISLVSIVMLALFLPDLTKWQPFIADISRLLFGLVGWGGSKIIQGFLSGTAKRISTITGNIDVNNEN